MLPKSKYWSDTCRLFGLALMSPLAREAFAMKKYINRELERADITIFYFYVALFILGIIIIIIGYNIRENIS